MDYDQLDVVLRADSEERNPDVLRAEMSVLTTQSSAQFSADAYAAIQNVQAQCAADMKSICSSEQIKLENRLVDDKLMTRRLSEQGSGMQMIKAIQSLYRHNSDNLINPSFVPRVLREKSKTSLKTVKDASADTAAAPTALAFPSAGVPRSSGGMKSLNLSPGPVIKKVNDVGADSGATDGAAPAGGPRGGPMAGGRGAGGRGFGGGRGGGRMAGGRGGFGGRGSEAAAESVGLAALENTDAAVAAESNGGTFVPAGGRGAGRGGAANGRGMGRMGGRGQQPNQQQQPPQAQQQQQQQLPPQMQPVPQQALPLTQSNIPSSAMPTKGSKAAAPPAGGRGSLVPQQQQTNGEGVVGAIKSIFVPGGTTTAATAPAVGAAPSTPNVKPAPPARVRPAAPVTTAAPPAAATAAADAAATAAAAAGPIHHHHSTVPIPVAPAAPAAVAAAPAATTTAAAPAAGKTAAATTPAVPVAAKTVATPAAAAAAPVAAKTPAAPAAPAKTVTAPVTPAAAPPKAAAGTPAAPAANGAAAAADADANVAVRPATEQGGPRLRGGHKRPNGGGATVAAAGRRTTATKRQQQPLHWHESDSEGSDSEGEGDHHHRGGPPPPKEGGRPGCGRPRHLTGPRAAPGMLGMHPHDHHEHEGREGEWGRPHDQEPEEGEEGPPCEEQEEGGPEGGWWAPPPPPMEQEEDLLYTGALGYGPSADLCMHQHYVQLSQPCAQAIDDLYQVREQFWQSASAPPPPPHHHGVLLLLLGVVLVACGVRRCIRRGRVQKIRTFMNAIRGNAALKATVERETGLAVPEPVCPQHQQQPCKKSWRCRLACAVTLVLSFLLAVDITGHVLHHMDERAAEQGEEPACPGKAIGILIGVFAVELLSVYALIKTGKWVKRTFFSASSSSVTVEPSAPVFTGDGYAPLPQGDDIDHMPATEMTTMRPITTTTTKMVMPSGAVVLVPVSAAPVSSVRMV